MFVYDIIHFTSAISGAKQRKTAPNRYVNKCEYYVFLFYMVSHRYTCDRMIIASCFINTYYESQFMILCLISVDYFSLIRLTCAFFLFIIVFFCYICTKYLKYLCFVFMKRCLIMLF